LEAIADEPFGTGHVSFIMGINITKPAPNQFRSVGILVVIYKIGVVNIININ
jgi:hypothetical protein